MSVTDSFWHPNNVPDDDDAAAYKAVHWAGLLNQAMDDPAGFGFVAAAVEYFGARVTKEDPTGPWAEYAALFISQDGALQ